MPDDFLQDLRCFVADLTREAPADLPADRRLFASGLMDSLNLLDLVAFVEQRCGFKVTPSEFTLDNWESLHAIESFVRRRGGG